MLAPNIHINVVGIVELGQKVSHPVLGQCTAREGQGHREQTEKEPVCESAQVRKGRQAQPPRAAKGRLWVVP